jgi:golgi-specific brefeldin A-resistance guanine nucleotide exchange factor 1
MIYDEKDHNQVDEIFNRVVFPLLDELLKQPVFLRDPKGMSETRLRASALLCKAFMHFELRDNRPEVDIRLLWIQVLDLLDRLMNVDKKDQLVSAPFDFRNAPLIFGKYEAVPESLKNVVLVMNAAEILVPPSADDHRNERQRTLWSATQERMDRFLPGFLADVISIPPMQLTAQEPPTPAVPTSA